MRTILFIEDDKIILEIISDWLRAEGFKVITAEDGKRGLESFMKAAEKKIDLILLDIGLSPGPDGDEMLRIVKTEHPNIYDLVKEIPIIVFSIHGWLKKVKKLPKEFRQIKYVISKPVETGKLIKAIKTLVK